MGEGEAVFALEVVRYGGGVFAEALGDLGEEDAFGHAAHDGAVEFGEDVVGVVGLAAGDERGEQGHRGFDEVGVGLGMADCAEERGELFPGFGGVGAGAFGGFEGGAGEGNGAGT